MELKPTAWRETSDRIRRRASVSCRAFDPPVNTRSSAGDGWRYRLGSGQPCSGIRLGPFDKHSCRTSDFDHCRLHPVLISRSSCAGLAYLYRGGNIAKQTAWNGCTLSSHVIPGSIRRWDRTARLQPLSRDGIYGPFDCFCGPSASCSICSPGATARGSNSERFRTPPASDENRYNPFGSDP